MKFWDTVKGHNLADVLIYCLPKLVEKSNEKTEQYIMIADNREISKIVNEELKKGSKVASMTSSGITSLIIFERKCK